MVVWNLLQKIINNRSFAGYAVFSIIIFIFSIILLNILFFFLKDEKVSAIVNLVIIFFCNFFYLVYFFNVDKKKSFLVFFLFSSLVFRNIEYFMFSSFIDMDKGINFAWIMSLLISMSLKFIYYKFFSKKFFIFK